MSETTEIALLIQQLDSKIDKMSSDFRHDLDKVQASLLIKLSSVVIVIVSIAFIAIAWMFDYRLDFINAKNQAHFEKLDAAVFISSDERVLNEIRELKVQMSTLQNQNRTDIVRKRFKRKQPKRKINNVGSRDLSSIEKESH